MYRINKINKLLKLATTVGLAETLWSANHPNRYSDDLSGYNSWKEDVKNTLGTDDDKKLSDILSGSIITSNVVSWSDFSSIFPRGEEIRRAWQKNNPREIESFLEWLNLKQHKTVHEILEALNDAVKTTKPSSGKTPIDDLITSPDDAFFGAILKGVGAPITKNNLLYFYAWRQAEGGKALHNPFNTTQKASGASDYNSSGVKNYVSSEQGVAATVKTLLNGRYEEIISCLKNDKTPAETAEALSKSPWGTGELAKKIISGYESGANPKPPEIAKA